MDSWKRAGTIRGAAPTGGEPVRSGGPGDESGAVPPWLDDAADDFGAPQAVIDALVAQLGFQPMARLIADRPAFRAALIAEYRRQCAALGERLLYQEWHL